MATTADGGTTWSVTPAPPTGPAIALAASSSDRPANPAKTPPRHLDRHRSLSYDRPAVLGLRFCSVGRTASVAAGHRWPSVTLSAVVCVALAVATAPRPSAPPVALVSAAGSSGTGFSGTGVAAYGSAATVPNFAGLTLAAPAVAIASTPTGQGYWVAAADGGVFTFGDAQYFNSVGATPL
jgi:hypothetical protein